MKLILKLKKYNITNIFLFSGFNYDVLQDQGLVVNIPCEYD